MKIWVFVHVACRNYDGPTAINDWQQARGAYCPQPGLFLFPRVRVRVRIRVRPDRLVQPAPLSIALPLLAQSLAGGSSYGRLPCGAARGGVQVFAGQWVEWHGPKARRRAHR